MAQRKPAANTQPSENKPDAPSRRKAKPAAPEAPPPARKPKSVAAPKPTTRKVASPPKKIVSKKITPASPSDRAARGLAAEKPPRKPLSTANQTVDAAKARAAQQAASSRLRPATADSISTPPASPLFPPPQQHSDELLAATIRRVRKTVAKKLLPPRPIDALAEGQATPASLNPSPGARSVRQTPPELDTHKNPDALAARLGASIRKAAAAARQSDAVEAPPAPPEPAPPSKSPARSTTTPLASADKAKKSVARTAKSTPAIPKKPAAPPAKQVQPTRSPAVPLPPAAAPAPSAQPRPRRAESPLASRLSESIRRAGAVAHPDTPPPAALAPPPALPPPASPVEPARLVASAAPPSTPAPPSPPRSARAQKAALPVAPPPTLSSTPHQAPASNVAAEPPLAAPGGSRLVLLARDPDWLYTYWDLSGGDLAFHKLDAVYGAPLVFLRLHALNHDGTPAATGSFDLMILPAAGNWLIQIPRIERDWQAEMGYIGRSGHFVAIASSNRLSSPYTEPAAEPLEPAEPVPFPSPQPATLATAAQPDPDSSPPPHAAEVIEIAPPAPLAPPVDAVALRVAGHFHQDEVVFYQPGPGLPPIPLLAPPPPPLLEGYAPAPYPNLQPLPPPWPVLPPVEEFFSESPQPALAGLSNAELEPSGASEHRLRPPPQPAQRPTWVEQAAASEQFARQARPAAPEPLPAGMPASVPFGIPRDAEIIDFIPSGGQPREKDFWLWVKTELVIYGATEPDARVTLRGLPLQLRSDGTFSVRFALPDGEIPLPVRAVNVDGDMEIQITPVVKRHTEE